MTNQGLTKAYQRKQLVRTYGEKGLIELPWKSVYSDKVSRNVCLIVIYNFVADAYLQKNGSYAIRKCRIHCTF